MIILLKGENPPSIDQFNLPGMMYYETSITPLGEISIEILTGRKEEEYKQIMDVIREERLTHD